MKSVTFFLVCSMLYSSLSGQVIEKIHFRTDPNQQQYGNVLVTLTKTELHKIDQHIGNQNFLKQLLTIYTGNSTYKRGLYPAIAGTYHIEGGCLIFQPKYPPAPGLMVTAMYNARLLDSNDAGEAKDLIVLTEQFPLLKEKRNTHVTTIYPSADTLPANLLRFYVHFSAPMSSQSPYKYLSIITFSGDTIHDAFVEIQDGLWDMNQKRLTVLIHPGRIKRGTGPHSTIGPVFKAGVNYSLNISEQWEDEQGNRISENQHKSFYISKDLRDQLNPDEWIIKKEFAPDEKNISIQFDRPMDHALMSRMIIAVNSAGKVVSGPPLISQNEKKWEIQLSTHEDNYTLYIDLNLEDVAGNSLERKFDQNHLESAHTYVSGKQLQINLE